jgi:hypothetical protein
MFFLLSFAQTVYAQAPAADVAGQEETVPVVTDLKYTYDDPSTFTGPNGIKEIQEKVYYNVLPGRPQINDDVEIEAEMYGTQVKNAQFTWTINGKEVLKGVGQYKLNFNLFTKSTVRVTILTGEGNTVRNTWEFNPKETDIIWEANTYTPPFYKGKSMFTPESTLVLHAINLDTENPLTNTYADYTWKVDGEVKGDVSGVGKNTYIYQGDLLLQEPLFQVITSPISTYKSKSSKTPDETLASIRVQTIQPDIFSYENSPLLGILFNHQLGSDFLFKSDETSIVSYPIYFGLASSLNAQYSWYINDDYVSGAKNSITFKKTKSNEQSRLSVGIQNPGALLQSKDISYIIDTSSNTNFLGFGQN